MIKINVPKSYIDKTQMLAIQHFEGDLKTFIKNVLNQSEYCHLAVGTELEINERRSISCELSSNASFGLKKSYDLVSVVKKWLQRYGALDIYLDNLSIVVRLNISAPAPSDNAPKQAQAKPAAAQASDLPNFMETKVRHSFDKIVLPQVVMQRIESALAVFEKNSLIYDTWGWREVDSVARSIINFYGKPGTGKTMCAHAIAHRLQKPLLALNYSEIESKYVGDAPKNLKHAFETAESMGAVLFFDEADSFLGKRIQNVTQGSEQALNSLRSQMLILLEEHEGIVLFATNLVSNFDKAFESRILANIEIPLPDREARVELIRKMTPAKLPLAEPFTDEQLLEVSDIIDGLSGREIKNAMLKMLTSNADDPGHKFDIDDLRQAMEAKMVELAALREEENRILTEKIAKSLQEKAAMNRAEKDAGLSGEASEAPASDKASADDDTTEASKADKTEQA